MKDCKVSIILPVYNTAQYLRECMDSLLAQTLFEIEIIAVNDGSTDNSFEILKEYQALNPNRVYVYNTENRGVSSARNFGAQKACGEFLWFVDSDDYIEKDACKTLYEKAASDGNDLVLFSRYDVDGKTGEKSENHSFHYSQNFKLSDKPYEFLKISPFPWNKLIKRELFDGVSFPEKIRFEDLPVAFILASKAKSIGVINDYFYNYRVKVGFLSSFTESVFDIIKALDYLRDELKKSGASELYKDEIEYITVRHFFYRFEQLFTVCGEESYELELKLINTLFDYLEKNYPKWQENKYIAYNLPDRLYKFYNLYSSREAMLELAEKCRAMTPDKQKEFAAEYEEKNAQPSEKAEIPFDEIKKNGKASSDAYNSCRKTAELREAALFVTSRKRFISSSMLALMLYLNKNESGVKLIAAVKKSRKEKLVKRLAQYGLEDKVRVIKTGGDHYIEALATSKYVISDCPLEYYFATRENQRYINIQLENISPNMTAKRGGRHSEYSSVQKSIITAKSAYVTKNSRMLFESAYNADCLQTGAFTADTPALDMLGHTDFEPKSEKKILFAPQLKASGTRNPFVAYRRLMANLMFIDSEVDDDVKIYVDLEDFPYHADFSMFSHVRRKPRKYDLYDFISSCDAVITDYSTILYTLRKTDVEIVRFMLDKKRYITDEELEISEDDYPLYTNYAQIVDYIKNVKKRTEKPEIKRANLSKEFFEKISNNEISPKNIEQSVCLYYLGGALTANRIKTFNELREREEYKTFYLAFDEEQNADYKTRAKYLKNIRFIALRYDNNDSFDEKIIGKICSKSRLPLGAKKAFDEQRKAERKKYFGSAHFDEMTVLSTGAIARNLLFIGLSDRTEYYFNWFSADKYKNKKAFKCKVDFICKCFDEKTRVHIPNEMKNVKALSSLEVINDADE